MGRSTIGAQMNAWPLFAHVGWGRALFVTCGILILLAAAGCQKGNDQNANPKKWAGVWSRLHEPTGYKVFLQFHESGAYDFTRDGSLYAFPGTFEVSGDVVKMVDLYCGTSFPGLYRFSLKRSGTESKLILERVDDEHCDRGKMLGGEWVLDTVSLDGIPTWE